MGFHLPIQDWRSQSIGPAQRAGNSIFTLDRDCRLALWPALGGRDLLIKQKAIPLLQEPGIRLLLAVPRVKFYLNASWPSAASAESPRQPCRPNTAVFLVQRFSGASDWLLLSGAEASAPFRRSGAPSTTLVKRLVIRRSPSFKPVRI